jgi:hypothetical protein
MGDDDIRRAAHLRYRFQDDASNNIWSCLLKSGWKYKPGEGYQAPNSDWWLRGNDVLRMLDEPAIAPIDNHLQLPPSHDRVNTLSEKLRFDVINALPMAELLKATRKRTPSTCVKLCETESNANDYNTRPKHNHQPSRKRKSSTNFDAGADLFLRQSKKNKIKRQHAEVESLDPEFANCRTVSKYFLALNLQAPSQNHSQHFHEWRYLLSTNHSLLLYGFGSKRSLLTDFRTTCLESVGDVLSIDGYDSSIQVEDVFDLMVEIFLSNQDPCGGRSTALNERAIAIGEAIAPIQLARKQPLYLMIHNIDGFRSREAQHAISLLLLHSSIQKTIRTIRLVASVDHVSATILLWDPETVFHFDFIWKEVHTYKPYIDELLKGADSTKSRLRTRTKSAVAATTQSIYEVLSTIAPRPTEVLQVLATLQLKHSSAISFRDLFHVCKTKCLAISDVTLREYMTELLTHGLMETSRDNGVEYLVIPHSNALLNDIVHFSPSDT